MSDRRYDDEETAAIFRAAAEGRQPAPQQQLSRSDGLTLADLQTIGREVGLSADAVAQAAVALDVSKGASQRTMLGFPIGVARTVDLNRRMTDAEWERLVVRLREVFNASGRTHSDGSFRQWTNGNLQVHLEPTETGQRLRFRTFHAGARASIAAGLAALGITAALAIAGALSGGLAQAAPEAVFVALLGVGMIANGALRLPKWARVRGDQMEALAAQAAAPLGLPEESTPSVSAD